MNRLWPTVLLVLLSTLVSYGSGEIQGSVADVLSAIRKRNVGRVYALNAQIVSPPIQNDSRFIVRDKTGSVVIRCDLDWPDSTFQPGDRVLLQGVAERAEALGGEFTIESTAGKGTHATVTINLKGLRTSDTERQNPKSDT